MRSETNMTELARLAIAGDREAFGSLYGLIAGKLYKTAYYTLGNKEDAENAVSDAVLDAWAGISSLRDPAAFQAWIFAILNNKCKRILREYVRNREKGSDTPVEDLAELLGNEDGSLTQAEDQQLVEAAFRVLTEEERQNLYAWVSDGNDIYSNPSNVASESGWEMDFITGIRADAEQYEMLSAMSPEELAEELGWNRPIDEDDLLLD